MVPRGVYRKHTAERFVVKRHEDEAPLRRQRRAYAPWLCPREWGERGGNRTGAGGLEENPTEKGGMGARGQQEECRRETAEDEKSRKETATDWVARHQSQANY